VTLGLLLVSDAACSHLSLVLGLVSLTSLLGKLLALSLGLSSFLLGLLHGSGICSLISRSLGLHVSDGGLGLSLGASSSGFSGSTSLSSLSSNSLGLLLGSLGVRLTLEGHLVLQLELGFGSLKLLVLSLGLGNLLSQSLSLCLGGINLSLGGCVLGVTKGLELGLLLLVLLLLQSSLLGGDPILLCLSGCILLRFLPLNLVSDGLEAVSFSLGGLLSETLGFGLLSLDGGNALLFGDASVLPLLPGGKTGLLTLRGESHLALKSLLEAGLDGSLTAAFLTSGTDGFLVGKVLLVLHSLTLSDLGKLLLTLELSGSELGSSFGSGFLGRSSLVLGSGNRSFSLRTATSLLSITLLVFHGSLGLGGSKLSLHFALFVRLRSLLLETLKLSLHLLRLLLGGESSLLLFVSGGILSSGLLLGSLVTSLSLSLGTSTLLRSLFLEFLLLLGNDRLRFLLHLLELSLGVLSRLLRCLVVS